MSAEDYNERVIRALEEAQRVAGIRSAAAFARRLAARSGGPPDTSTYQRWLRGNSLIPAWALVAVAEEAGQTIDSLLGTADIEAGRMSSYEARITSLEAQLNELRQQVTTQPVETPTASQRPTRRTATRVTKTNLMPLAAAVIVRGDRVLLTERRFPGFGEQWSWPSGKVEQDESLEEAVLRELLEELLLKEAHVLRYLGDIDLPSGYRMSHFQVAIPEDAEPKLNDYEQLVQTKWMTRDEARQAFKSLAPDIARRALEFLDQAVSSAKAAAKS